MNKLTDWSLARKLKTSNRQGILVGLAIAAIIVLVVVGVILKIRWLKKHFGGCCCCGDDIFDDDFLDDDDDCCDEDGCSIASEKDFV